MKKKITTDNIIDNAIKIIKKIDIHNQDEHTYETALGRAFYEGMIFAQENDISKLKLRDMDYYMKFGVKLIAKVTSQ